MDYEEYKRKRASGEVEPTPAAPAGYEEFKAKRKSVEPESAAGSENAVASTPSEPGLLSRGVQGFGSAVMSPIKTLGAAGETVLSGVTGMAADAVGGLAGLAVTPFAGVEAGANVVRGVQDAITYEPRTAYGQAFQQYAGDVGAATTGYAMEQLGEVGLNQKTEQGYLNPEAATAGYSLIPGALSLVPGGRMLRGKGSFGRDVDQPFDLSSSDVTGKPGKLANTFDPDPEALSAAQRQGIDINPANVARNEDVVEFTQLAKSSPDYRLSVDEQNTIKQIGDRRDDMMNQLERESVDQADFSKKVRGKIEDQRKQYLDLEEQLHDLGIAPQQPVAATNTRLFVNKRLQQVNGNMEALTPLEKRMMRFVEQTDAVPVEGKIVREKGPDGIWKSTRAEEVNKVPSTITYNALESIRKDISQAYKNEGPYRGTPEGILDQVYGALKQDKVEVAKQFKKEDQLKMADQMTIERKELETKSLDLFGSKLDQELSVASAAAGAVKGNLTNLNKLMDAMPETMRPEAAGYVLMRLSGNNKGSFSIGGFASSHKALRENPTAYAAITKHLPEDRKQEFRDLGTLSETLARTMKRQNSSRTTDARAMLKKLEDPGAMEKVIGMVRTTARQGASAAATSAATGVPVAIMAARRTKKTQTAFELLSSQRFKAAIELVGAGKIKEANSRMTSSNVYKQWAEQHPDSARAVKEVGFMEWVTANEREDGRTRDRYGRYAAERSPESTAVAQ